MRYKTYRPIIETVARSLKKYGAPCDRKAVYAWIMGTSVVDPIGSLITVDEVCWERSGAHTVFVDSKELVDALLGARIKLHGGEPPKLPFETFSVAPPSGCGLPPFLFCGARREGREKAGKTMVGAVGGDATFDCQTSKLGNIAIAITTENGGNRCNIPREMLADALEAEPDRMVSVLGVYKDCLRTLTGEESSTLSKCLRLALALSAYLEARPEYLLPGCPGDFHRRELEGRATIRGIDGAASTVKAPPGLSVRTHGTPCTHWRVWHFRRYPLKKDGSRTPGMVFVSDSIVNEDIQQQPHTAVEGT